MILLLSFVLVVASWIGLAVFLKKRTQSTVMWLGGSFVGAFMLLAVVAALFFPRPENQTSRDRGGSPAPRQVPSYQIVETKDISMGVVRRFSVRASLPQHYIRDSVEEIAKTIVSDLTRSQPVNAINIFFYGPGTSTAGAYDVAMVEWAPHGRWGDAGSVRAGDYATFSYSVSYKAPPSAHTTTLKASKLTGLLGAPLPEEATLLERTPGAAGRDPSERYAISSTAADIAAFFNDAMRADGWAKDGTSTEDFLIFCKGNLMMGILVSRDGKTFKLKGS